MSKKIKLPLEVEQVLKSLPPKYEDIFGDTDKVQSYEEDILSIKEQLDKNKKGEIKLNPFQEVFLTLKLFWIQFTSMGKLGILLFLGTILSLINSALVPLKDIQNLLFFSMYGIIALLIWWVITDDKTIQEKRFFIMLLLSFLILFIFCMITYLNSSILYITK